jgi:hypothetical protein
VPAIASEPADRLELVKTLSTNAKNPIKIRNPHGTSPAALTGAGWIFLPPTARSRLRQLQRPASSKITARQVFAYPNANSSVP